MRLAPGSSKREVKGPLSLQLCVVLRGTTSLTTGAVFLITHRTLSSILDGLEDSSCHRQCHLTADTALKLLPKRGPGSAETASLVHGGFCGLEESWEKKSVSLQFTGPKTTAGHQLPTDHNNTRVHQAASSTAPSGARTDGDPALRSFGATIRGNHRMASVWGAEAQIHRMDRSWGAGSS